MFVDVGQEKSYLYRDVDSILDVYYLFALEF